MRVLTDKEARRLLDAAAKITGLIEPLEARIAALEASANASIGALAHEQGTNLEARIARLERIESATRAAGAAQ